MRMGVGYDLHRLVRGRRLVIGGVEIPHEFGLLGHSDADVLLHSVCDALLGAAGLGDIGGHFPDTDPRFYDMDSAVFLGKAYGLIVAKGFHVNNVDATILAESPKMAPYVGAMKENLASLLSVGLDRVNVKATTMEGLGPIGRKEAIAALSIVSILGPD